MIDKIVELSQLTSAIIVIFGAVVGIITFFTARGQAFIHEKFIKPIYSQVNQFDIVFSKSYLTNFLAEVERGDVKSENQIRIAYEIYEHYTDKLNQNSYVHRKWDELKDKNLI